MANLKTRLTKMENKKGALVLIVVGENESNEDALIRHGKISDNSRVLFVCTGVNNE